MPSSVASSGSAASHVVGLSRSPSEADEHEECDVSDREAVDAAAARVLARHPRIDLLVYNAGVAGARAATSTATRSAIEQVIRVNYLGTVWTTLAFLPGLGSGLAPRERRLGRRH